MRFTYDPLHNIAYLRLQAKSGEVESVKVSDELVVDMRPDGTVYGPEFLNANAQLRREDSGVLQVVNEATGESLDVPLKSGA